MASPPLNQIISMSGQIQNHIVGGFGANSDNVIYSGLNALSYSGNPTPQGQVYKTYNSPYLIGLMGTGMAYTYEYVPDFGLGLCPLLDINPKTAAINTQINNYLIRYSGCNIMSPSIYMAATGFLFSTVADPTWPSSVSWAMLNMGRSIDYNDIQITRSYVNINYTGIGP